MAPCPSRSLLHAAACSALLAAACGGGPTMASGGQGTVSGVVLTVGGGVLPGVTVTVTPAGGTPVTASQIGIDANLVTFADGSYSVSPVPVGSGGGTVALSGLPAVCTPPAPATYSGLHDGGTVTVRFSVTCAGPAKTTGLWAGGEFAYSQATLDSPASSDPNRTTPLPADDVCPPRSGALGAEAFDAGGNLWVQRPSNAEDALQEYSAAQLADACSSEAPTAKVVFGTGGLAVQALTFDDSGNLWASNLRDQQILGFAAAQLVTAGGASAPIKPKWIVGGPALRSPGGIAFDAKGNLWVANGYSVLEFAAAAITSTKAQNDAHNAPIDPVLTLTTAADAADAAATAQGAPTTPLAYPSHRFIALAFDATGDLWVSATENTSNSARASILFSWSPAILGGSGTQMPAFGDLIDWGATTSMSAAWVGAIAFDPEGTLWLGWNNAPGGSNLWGVTSANGKAGAGPAKAVNAPLPSFGASLTFNPPVRPR